MNSPKNFDIIVAMDSDGLLGVKEYGSYSLPWPVLKEDVNFFKTKTTTTSEPNQVNAIILGWNTWLSLPIIYKKNPKRINIVVVRNSNYYKFSSNNETYVDTFVDALKETERINNLDKVYVIGGAAIYSEALAHPSLRNLYVTHIKHHYPKKNVIEQKIFFPIRPDKIKMCAKSGILDIKKSESIHDINTNISYKIVTYSTAQIYATTKAFHENYCYWEKVQRTQNIAYNPIEISIDNDWEYQFINLIKEIMNTGIYKNTRNAITKSIFGYQLKHDLSKGFPLLTVKRTYPRLIFEELMWMIRGQTNVKLLQEKNVRIWDKNSTKSFLEKNGLPYQEGDIGPGYGFQMRHYGADYIDCLTDYSGQGVDQLAECINLINNDPHNRRIIMNLWNPTDTNKMALAPCHIIYNFGVDLYDKPDPITGHRGRLNCHLLQRSWDVVLGWNSSTAALLTYLMANHCNLDPGFLVHSITDAHLYKQHIDSGGIDDLLKRTPRNLPTVKIICKKNNIDNYMYDDLVIENYYPSPPIRFGMIA
jgi:dihydrofolate reductase/thymidylate synthase